MHSRRIIGAMTGTSIDGIDLALMEIRGHGLAMEARFVRGRSAELGELAPRLRAAATQEPGPASFFAQLALDLGRLHARESLMLAEREPIDLVVLHGQTVHHAPPVSWQLINPFPIAAALRCAVISDLRQADLAAGGQGAPITPLADWVLFRSHLRRVILNLGGFANATAIPPEPANGRSTDDRGPKARRAETQGDARSEAQGVANDAIGEIRGADLCACNQLLDRAARRVLHTPFDLDGVAALAGRVDESSRMELERTLDAQRRAGRSLGTGDEAFAWVDRAADSLAPNDLMATAVSAIGAVVARGVLALASSPEEVILAGGGSRNRALQQAIGSHLPCPLRTTDELGIPIDMREAAEMAVLGTLATDGVSISLPAVTGRSAAAGSDGSLIMPARSGVPGTTSTPLNRRDRQLGHMI